MERRQFTVTVYRRAKSPYWQARVYVEGDGGEDKPGRRFSTGVLVGSRPRISEREAQAEAERRAGAVASAAQEQIAEESSTSLSAVAERMLDQKRADRRRDRAVDALAFNLDRHVLPFFGRTRCVTSIRRKDLEGFKVHLSVTATGDERYAPTTINNALTAIRQTLKYAANVEELLESVPHVRNVPVDQQGKGRALTRDQVQALLDAVDPRATEAREYLLFLANTGLRKTEALSIRWDWIDWDRRAIVVPAEYRKGGKKQLAPTQINDVVAEMLRARQARDRQPTLGRVWFQMKHDEARNSAAARAGLGGVRNHDLRHTLGSLAHADGASLVDIRDLLGHSTLAMVSRYGHSYADRLANVSQRLQLGGGKKRSVPGSVPGQNRPRREVSAGLGNEKTSTARRKP